MIVSIETPVFKGRRLRRLIDSVLHQSSPHWHFSLLWDGGDDESRRILEELDRRKHPGVTVYFAENRGIARARRFLSEHSRGDFILPVDDDDALPFYCIERFLAVAEQKPWASIIRAQRKIMDDDGKILDTPPWFPFEPRHYQHGMVRDLMNHTHPYLMRRSAYERTSGWEGFQDFGYAGEDCDIYLKLEEQGTIELLDETLYYYRLHDKRASLVLTDQAAYEMWRRLADKTIERIGLPLERTNERQLFDYQRLPRPEPTLAMVDFLIFADEGGADPAGAGPAAESLRRAGVAGDAVRMVARSAGALNEAVRAGSRPLLCLLDPAVELGGAEGIAALLGALHAADADLASPKLLGPGKTIAWAGPAFETTKRPVARGAGQPDQGQYDAVAPAAWLSDRLLVTRREVIRAVGGIDGGFADVGAAVVDFCLRARQRQFVCRYLGTVSFRCGDAAPGIMSDASLDRLQRKWAAYPQLFG